MTEPLIIENHLVRVDGPTDKELVFKNFQDIPDWYIQKLKDQTEAQASTPGKEMRRVASIPEAIVHAWTKQGFDIYTASAQEIVARLQKEDLGAFITGKP